MKMVLFFVASALALDAQEKPKLSAGPVASKVAVSSDRRATAIKLLDSAGEMVAAMQPSVRAAALFHLAHAYGTVARRKSLDLYQQAFAWSITLDDEARENLQPQLVTEVAKLNLAQATEMLRQMTVVPEHLTHNIVIRMLEKGEIEEAIQLVENTGSTGVYSFGAIEEIFNKLPAGDSRRVAVFASAMSGYLLHPNDEDGNLQHGFATLLARHYDDIPRSLAQLSLDAIVKSIVDQKDVEHGDNEAPVPRPVATSASGESDVMNLLKLIKAIDPKKLDEIAEKRPDLFRLLTNQNAGRMNSEGSGVSSLVASSGTHQTEKRNEAAELARQATRALADGNAENALEIARSISNAPVKIRILATIAGSLRAHHRQPLADRNVLAGCVSTLHEMKGNPEERVNAWPELAQSAYDLKDSVLAWDAFNHGIDDAVSLYKLDSSIDSPNLAPVEYWPSTQAIRSIVSLATRLFGDDAQALLPRIGDTDVAVLARIEVGSTLLGNANLPSCTLTRRSQVKR
jgi:plasmid stability protein